MNSSKRDIFWRGEIHQQCEGDTPSLPSFGDRDSDQQTIDRWNSYLKTATAIYPVQGSHSFKDGTNVTGRYKLQCELGKHCYTKGTHTHVQVAIPLPTPALVSELPKEAEGKAKELVEKFKPHAHGYDNLSGQLKENAKHCALIECEDMIDELADLINDSFISMDDIMRKKVEVKIEFWQQVRTAINNI